MKIKLVDNWRESVRWISMWCFGAIATIQGSVMGFITPDQMSAQILFYPEWTWGTLNQAVIAALAVVGGVGRLISQRPEE
jgi:hypothetical protein